MMATNGPTIRDYVAMFMPSVYMPPESFPSITGGLAILFLCIYTTTFPNTRSLQALRMALSIPAVYLFLDFGWNTSYSPKPTRGTWLGMGTIGCYGVMRILECCWVPLVDRDEDKGEGVPRWMMKWDLIKARRKSQKTDILFPKPKVENNKDTEKIITATGKDVQPTLALPTTFKERFIYSFDLLSSMRGSSWYGDRVWNWAPLSAATFRPQSHRQSTYVLYQFCSICVQYLAVDLMDTFAKSIQWNTRIPNPVTSQPIHIQLVASISVCLETVLAVTIPFTLITTLCVITLGSDPSSWLPMFDSPLYSASLGEFWTFRWHHMFRRVFGRLSQAVLNIMVPSSFTVQYPKATQSIRRMIIFTLSTLLHLVLMNLPPKDVSHPYKFLNASTLKFFLSQSIGLVIESGIIWPLTSSLPEGWAKDGLRRGFAWGWLLWTGRWWSDVWVARGMYDEVEKPIYWSPIRGMVWGRWNI